MVATLLNKLIPPTSSIFARLRHPVNASEGVTHEHTTLVITQDETGQFWLEGKCRHDWCQGNLRLKLLPEQIREWDCK